MEGVGWAAMLCSLPDEYCSLPEDGYSLLSEGASCRTRGLNGAPI